MTSMVALCTLVHTARGPTPRNHPAIPSVLYRSFRPVITDDVSRLTDPGFRTDVLGEDVEICRLCWADLLAGDAEESKLEIGLTTGIVAACGCGFVALAGEICPSRGLICVWIRVFTTSKGQVMTPAIPPAVAPVRTSRPKPISLLPAHCFAHFCSCS